MEIAETHRIGQRSQEFLVPRWHRPEQPCPCPLQRFQGFEAELDPIGTRGVTAAIVDEQAFRPRRCQKIEKADIVIAGKHDIARIALARRDQEVEHTARIRPPVDIVAKMDDAPVVDRALCETGHDPPVHLLQQIETPVDVADRMDAHAVRPARVEEMNARHEKI